MTLRLYYTDSYLRDFDAAVVDRADGGRRVYLDRTAFYPTSGGQPHDTGTLGGAAVVDTVDEGDRIAHLLADPIDGATVHGGVDWPRRFDHMQQHTGQHLLSAVLHQLFGHGTIAVTSAARARRSTWTHPTSSRRAWSRPRGAPTGSSPRTVRSR
jgi:alanyl-tRNA synthetase